ncbi:MAG: peptide deformylase [Streptosporangiaceae bacterium]
MAIRPIRLFGDPVLSTPAEPVHDFDRSLRKLVKDLTETLRDVGGAGLAAPQIGVGLRLFAYNVNGQRGYLVNPSLSFPDSEEQDGEEGCLSLPGIYFDVRRRQNTVARGFTDRGDPVQLVGTAVMARCIQHETDHLDGILFIDRMDDETRKAAMRAIRQAPWSGLAPGGPPDSGASGSAGAGGRRPAFRISPHPLFGQAR